MKFLIDECLTPDLVKIAQDRGHLSTIHNTWHGLRSRQDWDIVQYAINGGYVLVTNNRIHFVDLVSDEPIHAGLVCLNFAHGKADREKQCDLFKVALDELGDEEPVNEVIEITLDTDGEVSTARYAWPREPADNAEID